MVTHAADIRFRWWGRIWIGALALSAIAIVATLAAVSHEPDPRLYIQSDRSEIPAGGAAVHFTLRSSIPLPSARLDAVISKGSHSARVTRTYYDDGAWHVTVQSKGMSGPVTLAATLPRCV